MLIELKIQLTKSKLEMLFALYNYYFDQYGPEDKHEQLLYEHLLQMHHKLQLQINKDQQKNTITFTAAEAVAFWQTWETIKVKNTLADITVREIIAHIHKKSKNKISNGKKRTTTLRVN